MSVNDRFSYQGRPPVLERLVTPGPGPLALVGSGEYLPVMTDVEGMLLKGRPPKYVQPPTAAAQEGEGRPSQMGRSRRRASRASRGRTGSCPSQGPHRRGLA